MTQNHNTVIFNLLEFIINTRKSVVKNKSIRQLDFKSRAGTFSFGDKKPSRFIRYFILLGIVLSSIFGITWAGVALFSSSNDSEIIANSVPNDINLQIDSPSPAIANSTIDIKNSQSNSKTLSIQLTIPKNAPTPSGIIIPIESSNSLDLKQPNVNSTLKTNKNTTIKTPRNKQLLIKQSQSLDETETYIVKRGDTLSSVFKRAGLSSRELVLITKIDHVKNIRQIYPNEKLIIQKNTDGYLNVLTKRINETDTLIVRLDNGNFKSEIITNPLEIRTNRINSKIDSSLYLSAKKAQLNDNTIMQLAGVFGWDIDFALDIRKGDSFSIIYEEFFRDGEKVKVGNILAAEFINQNHRYVAVRYTDPQGNADYFTPDGKRMRKAFLRAPVDFRRISSKFRPQRWHPVLGVKRPHRGVDYAAATGTPIKASGDGKIIFRGWKGGYGRAVIIKHGTKYTTLYGHMSRYKKGKKSGSRVKQGDIIGYVGKSGLATGPHLHYEFRVNGVHRNPVTVKLPDATPINKKYKKAFNETIAPLLAEINAYSRTILALREKKEDEESSVE